VLLKQNKRESASAYAISGAVFGFAILLAIVMIFLDPSLYWMALLGAFSGAVTGQTWWRSGRQPNYS
jgi:hypothetical protein